MSYSKACLLSNEQALELIADQLGINSYVTLEFFQGNLEFGIELLAKELEKKGEK